LKSTIPSGPGSTAEWIGGKFSSSPVVSLEADSDDRLIVVKTARDDLLIERIQHDLAILKRMNHPLVVKHFPNTMNRSSAITTEFVTNGSLANHLPDSQNIDLSLLRGSTRIVKVIAGIALAMRYVHSQGVIHRNLTPDNILLDWDWNVRIANFGRSIVISEQRISSITDSPGVLPKLPSGDPRYVAPECYENIIGKQNDIFSFGLILYELIVGKPVFPRSMTSQEITGALVLRKYRPDIPKSVRPETAELIRDCWAINHWERLCFDGIVDRLEEMQFKLIRRVNSSKLTVFVNEIKDWEMSTSLQ
jgi:serine/threonine protein kinase